MEDLTSSCIISRKSSGRSGQKTTKFNQVPKQNKNLLVPKMDNSPPKAKRKMIKLPGGGYRHVVQMSNDHYLNLTGINEVLKDEKLHRQNSNENDTPQSMINKTGIASVWGGKAFPSSLSFGKKKNFFTNLEAAHFNGGVVPL
jgi:hypothetical protein